MHEPLWSEVVAWLLPVKHVCNCHWQAFSLGTSLQNGSSLPTRRKGAKAGRSRINGIAGEKEWGRDRVSMGRLTVPLGRDYKGPGIGDCFSDVTGMGQPSPPPPPSQQWVGSGLGTGWVLSGSSRPKSKSPFIYTTSDQLLSLQHLLDAWPSGTAVLTDGKAGSGGGGY